MVDRSRVILSQCKENECTAFNKASERIAYRVLGLWSIRLWACWTVSLLGWGAVGPWVLWFLGL